MKAGTPLARQYDLRSLRFLGSVGEPLNPEGVVWGVDAFGQPFHDNWWQTETGGIMIANLASMNILERLPPQLQAKALSMRRRFAYACVGGLLSAGAPVGLFAVRLARRSRRFCSTSLRAAPREVAADPPDYIYVGMSTAVAFTLFGYMLGRQADRLADLSVTDPLTGLSNARGLFDRLDAELARSRRYREPLALLSVDLDGLKRINDRYGHRAGDDAIRSVADVIRSALRESDVGARWGGDEFAVLAPSTSRVAALALAERIRALIPQRSTRWPSSVSVGVVTLDPNKAGESFDSATLMRAADAAMYEAKQSGRDRVVVASPGKNSGGLESAKPY